MDIITFFVFFIIIKWLIVRVKNEVDFGFWSESAKNWHLDRFSDHIDDLAVELCHVVAIITSVAGWNKAPHTAPRNLI